MPEPGRRALTERPRSFALPNDQEESPSLALNPLRDPADNEPGRPDRGLVKHMLTGNGLARRVHVALIGLLVVGVGGSFWMSLRARSTAEERAVDQAQVIAESSLTLVFTPDDLTRDASSERSENCLARSTMWWSTPATSKRSPCSPGPERSCSRPRTATSASDSPANAAASGTPTEDSHKRESSTNTLSVLVGLRFPSGVGSTAAVEMSRPAEDITGAAAPWRTNMFFLGGALALVLLAAGAPCAEAGTRGIPRTPSGCACR